MPGLNSSIYIRNFRLRGVLVFVGCGNGTTSIFNGSSGGKGTLIIKNSPTGGYVYICNGNAPLTQKELSESQRKAIAIGVSYGTKDRFTYKLSYVHTMEAFSGTGSYLVIFLLGIGSDEYFLPNVKFTNGSATVDFNNMNSASNLPSGNWYY
jgi:hypothetical protein